MAEQRHLRIEQTYSDHFVKGHREPEYWRSISYQERNSNLLLAETIKLIEQMKHGVIDIMECSIEIGYRGWMYYAQFGMFAIPPLDHKNLKRLHGMAFGIPRNGPASMTTCVCRSLGSCSPTQAARPQTGYCRRRGKAVRKGSCHHGQRTSIITRRRRGMTAPRRAHSGGVFDLRVGEWSFW